MPPKKKKPEIVLFKLSCSPKELDALRTQAEHNRRTISQEILVRCFPPSK